MSEKPTQPISTSGELNYTVGFVGGDHVHGSRALQPLVGAHLPLPLPQNLARPVSQLAA